MTFTGLIGRLCMYPLQLIIRACVRLEIHPNVRALRHRIPFLRSHSGRSRTSSTLTGSTTTERGAGSHLDDHEPPLVLRVRGSNVRERAIVRTSSSESAPRFWKSRIRTMVRVASAATLWWVRRCRLGGPWDQPR